VTTYPEAIMAGMIAKVFRIYEMGILPSGILSGAWYAVIDVLKKKDFPYGDDPIGDILETSCWTVGMASIGAVGWPLLLPISFAYFIRRTLT